MGEGLSGRRGGKRQGEEANAPFSGLLNNSTFRPSSSSAFLSSPLLTHSTTITAVSSSFFFALSFAIGYTSTV